ERPRIQADRAAVLGLEECGLDSGLIVLAGRNVNIAGVDRRRIRGSFAARSDREEQQGMEAASHGGFLSPGQTRSRFHVRYAPCVPARFPMGGAVHAEAAVQIATHVETLMHTFATTFTPDRGHACFRRPRRLPHVAVSATMKQWLSYSSAGVPSACVSC